MRRRTSIFALLFAVLAIAPWALASQDELTLRAPKRTPVRPLSNLRDLAVPLEIAPYLSAEDEPNDTLATATRIGVPGHFSGTTAFTDPASITVDYSGGVRAGVTDIYALTLSDSRAISVDLTWSGTEADLDLFVFERVEDTLVIVDGSARADAAAETVQTQVLQPGTYYLGIAAFSGSTAYNLTVSGIALSASCVEDLTTMCLNNGRFRVRATWTAGSNSGNAGAVPLTSDTGFLWFFNNGNVELVVKVLDACTVNDRFWVFAGGLTDVSVGLTITDTVTGATKEYSNSGGRAFQPITDTAAFATCGAATCSYSLAPGSQSFGSSGGAGSFTVNTQTGCNWSANSNASWISLTSGASGNGTGGVSYSVATNGSSGSRTGTITAGGQTHTVTQSGASGGNYNGSWSGTTTQGKTISFVVANNLITSVSFGFDASGSCSVSGTTTTTYTPGRPINGTTFTLTGSGTTTFTINGSFNSSTSASGSLNVTYSQPFPACTATGSATWTAGTAGGAGWHSLGHVRSR